MAGIAARVKYSLRGAIAGSPNGGLSGNLRVRCKLLSPGKNLSCQRPAPRAMHRTSTSVDGGDAAARPDRPARYTSIVIIIDLEQRERAEDVRRVGRRRRMQVGVIELG